MSQPINITTLSGVRLDVNPSATIEVNMGGISLLNLQDRTATYTNSFSLPRTPTNEAVFEFASQPTRNNKPSINVWISKGLFQRSAVLKVLKFDNDYKCSISYDDTNVFQNISNYNFYDLQVEDEIVSYVPAPYSDKDILTEIYKFRTNFAPFAVVVYNHRVTDGTPNDNSTAYSALGFLSKLEDIFGVSIVGDVLSDTYFQKSFIFNKFIGIEYEGITNTIYSRSIPRTKDIITCGEILKTLSNIFFFDIKISNNTITLNRININETPILLEGFKYNKQIQSPYNLNNRIVYNVDSREDKLFGSDNIVSAGANDKEILKINSFIPVYYDTTYFGYDTSDKDALSKLIIMGSNGYTSNTVKSKDTSYTSAIQSHVAYPLDMNGYYSNILNPIFANPVILEADKWLDPFTANQIMESRIINSVQLGGRYWVDTMAYNLTTGQSKMTLIKI